MRHIDLVYDFLRHKSSTVLTNGALAAAALVLSFQPVVYAQSTGAVPANCTISADNRTMTCTTTVSLNGVAGSFSGGTLTLASSGAAGPTCSGGLTANPQSGLTPNTATAIQLQACPQNTNRATLDFRWVAPAVKSAAGNPWDGTATANVPSGQSVTYSVNVCDSVAANAACTTVTTAPITATGASALPVCTAITGTQSVVQNGSASALGASCSNATSYQWYQGASVATGTAISGATGATYIPSTASIGTFSYVVRATNGSGFTDNNAAATVTVSSAGGGGLGNCASLGEPRLRSAFNASANFTNVRIEGSGIYVIQITVSATDSTNGRGLLPGLSFTQDNQTAGSNRTVTLSRTCNDFSANARVIASGSTDASTQFRTAGDTARAPSVIPLSEGIWYLNVRNDTCPLGTNCSMSGIWRHSVF
jgi:hypothetical protein